MNLDQISEHYHGDPTDATTERARQRIHWICSQATGQDILDLGCSQGIVCQILGREGFRCTGVDIEAASLTVAEQALAKEDELVRGRVKFQLADASQLPFADESFDTVVLGEILEHLTHPDKVLGEARRVLREGGRVVVTVPYGLNAFHDHKRTFYPITLLELLQPLFQTRSVDTLNNFITYTGLKRHGYSPETLSKDSLFDDYVRLEKQLEARCLEKEQALLETGTKLYAQIRTLTTQATAQTGRIKEIEAAVAAKNKQIDELGAGLEEARRAEAALRRQAEETGPALAQARTEAATSAAALVTANQQLAALQAENAGLHKQLAAKEDAVAGLQADLANADAVLAGAKRQTARLKQESNTALASTQQRLEALETERAGLQRELAAKDELLAHVCAEGAAANPALAAARQQVQSLLAEHTSLRQELAAKTAAWEQRLTQAEKLQAGRQEQQENQLRALLAQREDELKRLSANQRLREVVRSVLPAGARVLVISKGDEDLLHLDGRLGSHFPQTSDGVYAGYHPADSAEAISHLEDLKAKGAAYLLIPASAFWWLEFYAEFRRHLETECRLLTYDEGTCLIFALAPPVARAGQLAFTIREAAKKTTPTPAQPAPAAKAAISSGSPAARETKPAAQTVGAATPAPAAPGSKGVGLRMGGIFDEFTAACFQPECTLVTFRPDNWKSVLEQNPIDLLFIESAWQGNGGSWQYKVASFKKPMGEELVDLVNYCKDHHIPTVFWNKEDPAHFGRFIHRAPLFDVVFTSDADMIPKYREALRHEKVFALPFAAQPRIHHPIQETDRLHNVCFAGAYYAADHDERRADMDHLLRPALAFGLHIYDRQHGLAGPQAKLYRFPEIYQSSIQGRLEYDEMVKAYKWYKVFLNVNSVKQSPTMFSRRVFELLASGTPVISAYAKGIVELLGKDIVSITRSEQETKAHLERLLNDESHWAQVSLRGIREVLSRHTYAHRMGEICRRAGLPWPGLEGRQITAVASVSAPGHVQRLISTLRQQTYRKFNLVVVAGKTVPKTKLDSLRQALPDIRVEVRAPTGHLTQVLLQAAAGQYIWLVNLNDHYEASFLGDAALAAVYCDADVIGKQTHYELVSRATTLRLVQPGHDFRFAGSFSPGSVLAKPGKLDAEQWKALAADRAISISNLRSLSIDRFNYVRGGGTIQQPRGQAAVQPLAAARV